jgi:hypothetical protein
MGACRAEAVPDDVKTMIDVTVNPGGSSKLPLTSNRQVQKLTMLEDYAHIGITW